MYTSHREQQQYELQLIKTKKLNPEVRGAPQSPGKKTTTNK